MVGKDTLGHFPANVHVLRTGLPCEPCWFAKRFQACNARMDCLVQLGVDQVESVLRRVLGASNCHDGETLARPGRLSSIYQCCPAGTHLCRRCVTARWAFCPSDKATEQ